MVVWQSLGSCMYMDCLFVIRCPLVLVVGLLVGCWLVFGLLTVGCSLVGCWSVLKSVVSPLFCSQSDFCWRVAWWSVLGQLSDCWVAVIRGLLEGYLVVVV